MYSQVTIKVKNRGEETEVWFVLETNHSHLGALYYSLQENGLIYGVRLTTKAFGTNSKKVVDQYETIIHRDSIVSISEMQADLIGTDGAILYRVEDGSTARGVSL